MGLNPPAGGSTGGLEQSSGRISFDATALLDIFTPVDVVSAPGAGKWILVTRIVTQYIRDSADYVVADTVIFQTAGAAFDWGDITSVIAASGVDSGGVEVPVSADFAPYDLEDQPVQLLATSSNLTTGDGTLDVEVFYIEMDVWS